MKKMLIALTSLLICSASLAFAADNNPAYFINPNNTPITIHYKACHDSDIACESSAITDAAIPAGGYIKIEIPGPSDKVPYGEAEIKIVSMEAFDRIYSFDTLSVQCGVNPRTGFNAVKYEMISDKLACSKLSLVS